MTYLITFSCYGHHLHGDPAGSVDKEHKVFRTPHVPPNPERQSFERGMMRHPKYAMNSVRREAALDAIRRGCQHRGWGLLAAQVRSTHVHIVVEATERPELIMNACKSYASQRLNELRLDASGQKRWTRHGSTRWLNQPSHIAAAITYELEEQGEPMSVHRLGGSERV